MSATRKILVIDDDAVVAKSFDRVLKSKGYAVITVRSGEEALLKLKNERYDVVFTDIRMPGMSGIDVAEQVKKSQPWLPVVVITGYGTVDNEVRAEAAGVSGFLRKPLSPEMIEASTDKALQETDAVLAAPAVAETVAVAAEAAAAPTVQQAELPKQRSTAKNIGLFFAAPFIGLAYIIAMPIVGMGMLAWFAGQAMVKAIAAARAKAEAAHLTQTGLPKQRSTIKNIGLFFAAPFIGLAYIVAMPIVGVGMLAWFGAQAVRARK